jgi:hypothetical protein
MGRHAGKSKAQIIKGREAAKLMVGVGLVAHLHNLVEDILKGDASKLSDFQQYIQFAPNNVKQRLLQKINYLQRTGN